MEIVLDSCALIAATNLNDPNHAASSALISRLKADGYKIIAPVTQLWDVAAYSNHPEKSKRHAPDLDAAFVVEHHDVTHNLFISTYSSAMTAIKGPDCIFVSLAKAKGLTLVTDDGQILKNAANLGVRAISVSEFVANGA